MMAEKKRISSLEETAVPAARPEELRGSGAASEEAGGRAADAELVERITDLDDDEPVGLVDPQMFDSLAHGDYKPQDSIGEIVDNAVEAGAKEIFIRTKLGKPQGRSKASCIEELAVIDTGRGMDYQTIKRCLRLGHSCRSRIPGKAKIGRFGMGLTSGAVSLAKYVGVYSRMEGETDFRYVYLDTEEVVDKRKETLPLPCTVAPTESEVAEYAALLGGSSGTIVVLKRIRVKYDIADLDHYLARTYRTFIRDGLEIDRDGKHIYLHDPLFLDGPTIFDIRAEARGEKELKAELVGKEVRIKRPVPESPGETADVVIRISLLPEEWWIKRGSGATAEAKERKIPENEGVSILREGREVLYGKVPRLFGGKDRGQENYEDIDRWWGCEISFPAELDSYFEVRYSKRGIEPNEGMRDAIRKTVGREIKALREKIRAKRAAYEAGEAKEELDSGDPFAKAEEVMAKAAKRLPRRDKGVEKSREEKDAFLERIVDKRLDSEKYQDRMEREKKKLELSRLPLVVHPVDTFDSRALFRPEHEPGQTVLHLNVKHPFYTQVLEPLCGTLDCDLTEADMAFGAKELKHKYMVQRRDVKNAILLLLFSLARAERQVGEDFEDEIMDYRNEWGAELSTAVRTYQKEIGE